MKAPSPGRVIVVFVKAPVPGRVKTRLCPPLAPEQAAALYSAFAKDSIEAARGVVGARVEIAYDGAAPFPDPGWLGGDLNYFQQEGPDLGRRLKRAFHRVFLAGADQAVVIGSDMPDLEPGMLLAAFQLLADNDAAIGPATDGGYYLLGLKRPCPSLFEGISWSTGTVLRETKDRMRKNGLRLGSLPERTDVDTGADLAVLSRSVLRGEMKTARFTRAALAGLGNTLQTQLQTGSLPAWAGNSGALRRKAARPAIS